MSAGHENLLLSSGNRKEAGRDGSIMKRSRRAKQLDSDENSLHNNAPTSASLARIVLPSFRLGPSLCRRVEHQAG